MRAWAELGSEEKFDVLRLLFTGQTVLELNNLAILAENGLASADDIESVVQAILKTLESSKVSDAADIASFRQRLENLMVEARQALGGE